MRHIAFLLLSCSILTLPSFGQNLGCKHVKNKIRFATEKAINNADSVHISHYAIYVDSISFDDQTLWSMTKVNAVSKVDGLNVLRLDLQNHTVDSVVTNAGMNLTYTYDGLNLNIEIPTLNTGEGSQIRIYYHGQPSQDPSGWGGFYWQGTTYAFNLGVGFDENPHVYGRAWYPCLDVFTDKSTYEFHITVDSTYLPVCNGEMVDQTDLGNGKRTTVWEMQDPIPSYLVAMAIAPFTLLEREYSGIPAIYACLPSDTNNVNNTFGNMQQCVDLFLDQFGPYRFNRIGYSLVPFGGGAMEHATSIHIGKDFIDGSLTYETLWVHELAHMWWGDNVTCTTAEDMWLNEGWAAYSEALFTEHVYGEEAYMNWFRPLHRQMLQFAHIQDGDYYAMNDIPHAVTYGSHVYEKGPLMCHSIRGYMGDELFFEACKAFQDSLEFGNASSVDMMNIFSESSGLDMTGFFEGWILQPGWAHFSIDSLDILPLPNSTTYQIEVDLRQRSRANQHLYQMNIPVFFTDGNGTDTTLWFPMNTETQSFTADLGFEPKLAMIDGEEEFADAMATFTKTIDTDGLHNFSYTNAKLRVEEVGSNESLVRIADNFVAPNPIYSQPGVLLNPYHYWTVEGILADGFNASIEFDYNGTTSVATGYMDNDLFINNDEDSLLLMYRPGPGHGWQEPADYIVKTGANVTNLRGSVEVNNVQLGEYVLAIYDSELGNENLEITDFNLFPNPASNYITIQHEDEATQAIIEVTDQTGRKVKSFSVRSKRTQIDISDLRSGMYSAALIRESKKPIIRNFEVLR